MRNSGYHRKFLSTDGAVAFRVSELEPITKGHRNN
jgi:hypothetical protein